MIYVDNDDEDDDDDDVIPESFNVNKRKCKVNELVFFMFGKNLIFWTFFVKRFMKTT